MNSLTVSIVVLAWFALAYIYYGRFIERTLGRPDPAAVTPAHRLRDDRDYSPSKRRFLWCNHFSSIAGAGPIIGPIVAVSYFGWGPTLIWVALGAVFMGAVHDYLALMVSVRHDGQGISRLASAAAGRSTAALFAVMLYVVLVLLIAVFMVSVAHALINVPALVIPTFGLVGVALLLGWALERWRAPELVASPLAVFLAYFLIWVGYHAPISLPAFLGAEGILAFWLVVLTAYCLLASVAPMWMLLRPRDFISGIKLGVGMLLGFAGIALARPVINAPFSQGVLMDHGKPLWPILFVLVACGAISGFHAIVSTGTTARQLNNEKDARGVAFGGMLTEGALALLVVMVVCAGLQWGAAPEGLAPAAANQYFATALKNGWIVAFGHGFGQVVGSLELPLLSAGLAALLGAVMVKSFILTTLDAGTRLARFLVNESLGKKVPGLGGLWIASLVVLAPAFLLALTNTYAQVWKLFGATNQLIAALTLVTVTVFLSRDHLPRRYTLVPAGFMLLTTTAALLWEMFNGMDGYLRAGHEDWLLGGIACLLIALELMVLWKVWRALAPAASAGLSIPAGLVAERVDKHRLGL
ncbi:MAG: carbon starvation CstA family protein [Pseudomonadota bacterium]